VPLKYNSWQTDRQTHTQSKYFNPQCAYTVTAIHERTALELSLVSRPLLRWREKQSGRLSGVCADLRNVHYETPSGYEVHAFVYRHVYG
jgi:hypothetical protein